MKDPLSREIICKNCQHAVSGNYCSHCGQSAPTHPINLQYVVQELQAEFIQVDRGFFYSMRELFLRPGNTIRDFISGKRVKQYKPMSYVILLSIIHAFLEHFFDRNPFIEDFLTGFTESLKGKISKPGIQNFFQVLDWLIINYAYTALLLIPVFSLASYWAFRRARFNYFEHLVLNTYTFGQITVIFILSLPLYYLLPSTGYTLDYLRIVLAIGFTFWSYFQFFNKLKGISRIGNALLTYSLFFGLLVLIFILSFSLFML